MRIVAYISSLLVIITGLFSFISVFDETKRLRKIYSGPPSQWPKPFVNDAVNWTEIGLLPESPIAGKKDSQKHIIELGKTLFFDPRLSGSGKISCATCHQPELNWTDDKEKSVGHEGAITKRNAPTIQNSWFYNRLFWDGRSKDLQDQAFAPINSETEMHSEMHDVMQKLSKSKGYKKMFKEAFGSEDIDPFVMTEAIATFEKTITSNETRFDKFLKGDKAALTNSELRGLHIFRTKAKCMNCHHGPLLTDNQFHNNGFHQDGDPKNDKGYYLVSHKEEDIGKFKTPSLRDVMHTRPWMHHGLVKNMEEVLAHYQKGGMAGTDTLIQRFSLTRKEQGDLINFLKALSAPPVPFQKPVLPE
jgi:cytochrome c peroxidase